jgi:TonB family protein
MRAKAILVFLIALALSAPASLHAQTQDPTGPGVYRVGGGVSPPRPTYHPNPEFSEQARAAHYQGVCTLKLIVEKDGTPSHIKVTSPLGMGLDEKAIEAVSKWRFEPGMKDGEAVGVEIAVMVDFTLYDRNDREIAKLMQKANSGDATVQLELANKYLEGKEVGKNDRLAEAYLEKAASQGLPKAQFELAEHFATSDSPDYAKAYMWFTLAQRAGYKQSGKALKELASKITPEQQQAGQTLADKWTPAPQK